MAYKIIFVEKERSAVAGRRPKERAVGESVFLASLPSSPKVFAFFYQGDADTAEVEQRLRALGQKTGDNLFVNIGTLIDPDYKRAVECFGIGPLPVIIVTAVGPLASTPEGETTFVRLDGKSLFEKPHQLVQTIEKLFNLFLGGKILKAIMVGWAEQRKAGTVAAAERVWAAIQPVIAWAAKKDIKIGLTEGTIEVRESGGH